MTNSLIVAVMSYSEGKEGTLYWRTRPYIESKSVNDDKDEWSAYCRLLISSKPAERGIINP